MKLTLLMEVAAKHICARGIANVYAPELLIERKTRTGKKRFRESLFPCYIFIQVESVDCGTQFDSLPGVNRVLRRGKDPTVVSDLLIAELRRSYSSEEATVAAPVEFLPDMAVDIVDGCFQGESARVIGSLSSGERIRVLLEFLGRDVEIDIPVQAAFAKPY